MNTSSLPPEDGPNLSRLKSFFTTMGLSVVVGYDPDGAASDAQVALGQLSLTLPAARLAAAVKQTSGKRRLTALSSRKPNELPEVTGQLEFELLDLRGAASVVLRNYLLGREGHLEDEAELAVNLDGQQFRALVAFLDEAVDS